MVVALLAFGAIARHFWQTAVSPPPVVIEQNNASAIDTVQARIAQNPDNPSGYAQLGLLYLQRVRETGDAVLYVQAEQVFARSLELDPNHVDALMGQGMLALARHDFRAALEWAERARAQNPYRSQILGIMVDAYVELGEYDKAVESAQAMVDLRPDLASYSRISYLRELHGDVDGAIVAMEAAVSAGSPGSEQTSWTQVQLGNLYLNSGDFETAERFYKKTLSERAGYPFALAGLAEVEAARGNYEKAIQRLRPLVERLPLPEFTILLGDLYTIQGNNEAAARQYDLVHAIQQLNNQAGMNTELEMALFIADQGDPQKALTMAQAAYEQRPSIYAAESLAWAYYKAGQFEQAWRYSEESLKLDTQDAHLYYRASLIANAMGNHKLAQQLGVEAQTITPAQHLKKLFEKG